ncbi:MBL fold metallo-hydrolase [uncultured Desulfosarcina sp.]|uniref:ribonuclease Z n=1 Tax=uncultured Desulfosarcina sp. TaxID=218289 RepID=UPI0029C65D14|nr:MBL fold metallo-hydrolase [uncultured Desulfosarcina sp.]
MGPSFLPRLVNGPFDDPALFVSFRYQNRAMLFDLGDIASLPARDILKITHIFISHTHMDHFVGFDRLLRIFLGRNKDIFLWGPQGFLANLEGKLGGYCWNLVENYENRFTLHSVELHPDRAIVQSYPCRNGFSADGPVREMPFDGIVLAEPALTVNAVHLDHGIPVLGFALREQFHINIMKVPLERLGLAPGPWLNHFKAMLYRGVDPGTPVDIPSPKNPGTNLTFALGELKSAIARITPGQSLAYIADAAGIEENFNKIKKLAGGVDHLFVEAAFSHVHEDIAKRKRHLTARQAGELARACRVKQYSLFHYSPRYTDCPDRLEAEAEKAFGQQPSMHA